MMYFEAKLKLITTRNNPENGSQPRLDAFQADAANGAPCLKSHRVLSYPEIKAMCAEVGNFLDRAERAAKGEEPRYQRFRSWWSGTSTEAAYKNLHYAEASMARLYEPAEIRAELPDAVRRASAALSADDPTRLSGRRALAADGNGGKPCYTPEELSVLIGLGHEAADRQRARLRAFRNVLLVGCLITTTLVVLFTLFCAFFPQSVPLCFTQDPPPQNPNDIAIACPTGQSTLNGNRQPSPMDVLMLVILGTIGGVLSSVVFIRGLYANSTPYNVAVPLALLKIPTGALAAVVGMMLVAGDFVPGFSAIDKQPQILAYSLLFGFAQQLFTGILDRRAKTLIANVPTKAKDELGDTSGRADRT